jgi:Fur family ferric uptake transcriptional regulator
MMARATGSATDLAAAGPAAPASSPSEGTIVALLADHGYRVTGPRRAVVGAVLGRERPFTAEQVVAEVKRAAPEVGRATVYRTLEILAAIDVLTRLLQPDGHPAYVVGAPGHRHHLVCSDCGATVAFTRCPIDELVGDLTRDTEFAIHGHLLEVFGVCPECQGDPAAASSGG